MLSKVKNRKEPLIKIPPSPKPGGSFLVVALFPLSVNLKKQELRFVNGRKIIIRYK